MFERSVDAPTPVEWPDTDPCPDAWPGDDLWPDDAHLDPTPEDLLGEDPAELVPPPPTAAGIVPSGGYALELDAATSIPAVLSAAELVDAAVGYERLAAWAVGRQQELLAEFHRRPGDGTVRPAAHAPHPAAESAARREWAVDEIGLALTLAPAAAAIRMAHADRAAGVLRATRDLLAAGRICPARARLIHDMLAEYDDSIAAAVQARVLPRAPEQTWGQLRAALARAILAVVPDPAHRHRGARKGRRVELWPGREGMATLAAHLSAADATAAYEWITRLARGLPGDTADADNPDPDGATGTGRGRGSMDRRRADVAAALLTGRLIATNAATNAASSDVATATVEVATDVTDATAATAATATAATDTATDTATAGVADTATDTDTATAGVAATDTDAAAMTAAVGDADVTDAAATTADVASTDTDTDTAVAGVADTDTDTAVADVADTDTDTAVAGVADTDTDTAVADVATDVAATDSATDSATDTVAARTRAATAADVASGGDVAGGGVTSGGAGDPAPAAGAAAPAAPVSAHRPLIHVTVPITTLMGLDDEPAELAGYGPIPAPLARQIAADPDSTWRRLLTDPVSGTLLDYGRRTYRPPAALAGFVRARDGHCRYPGCRRAAAACEIDHVQPWQHGGTTSEDNLCELCERHHDLKEQIGWRVVLHPDRRLEWITPTGHHYWSRPVDHRPPRAPALSEPAAPDTAARQTREDPFIACPSDPDPPPPF